MFPPVWGQKWPKYKLFIQATHYGAITYLWWGAWRGWGVPLGRERAWGRKMQPGGREKHSVWTGESCKTPNGAGTACEHAGGVRAELDHPPAGTHEPPAFVPVPTPSAPVINCFEEAFILRGEVWEIKKSFLEMVKMTPCQTHIACGRTTG